LFFIEVVESLCSDAEMILMLGSVPHCQNNKKQDSEHANQSRHRCYFCWYLHKKSTQLVFESQEEVQLVSQLQEEGTVGPPTTKRRQNRSFNYIPNLLCLDYAHSCKLKALQCQKKSVQSMWFSLSTWKFQRCSLLIWFSHNKVIMKSKVTYVVLCLTTLVSFKICCTRCIVDYLKATHLNPFIHTVSRNQIKTLTPF